MLVFTNSQILTIFDTEKPLNTKPLYFPKKSNNDIKGHIIDGVDNRAVLQPFDKLILFACLAIIQSGGGFATVSTIYRQITGKSHVFTLKNHSENVILFLYVKSYNYSMYSKILYIFSPE